MQIEFAEIIELIKQSQYNAVKAVNTELINLYWNVGRYIFQQLETARWGEKTVDELAGFIQLKHPEIKGFTRRSLYRMKQFYETYAASAFMVSEVNQIHVVDFQDNVFVPSMRTQMEAPEVVPSTRTQFEHTDIRNTILTKLSWTHHRTIFSRCRTEEEREFYIKKTINENYTVRELDRQINSSLFERFMLTKTQTNPAADVLNHNLSQTFKDQYIFEFLNLPDHYSENDLQKGLIMQMKNVILELGKDFLFVSEEYKVMVGNSDFYIDLLFYHRGLQCLVAFELKTDKFIPEYLGKLNFYLEALDRDVKKPNEKPSIGILLCKDKDTEVVEYAMSRSLSPAMVAAYKTMLPEKKILQQKLHELFENTTKINPDK